MIFGAKILKNHFLQALKVEKLSFLHQIGHIYGPHITRGLCQMNDTVPFQVKIRGRSLPMRID